MEAFFIVLVICQDTRDSMMREEPQAWVVDGRGVTGHIRGNSAIIQRSTFNTVSMPSMDIWGTSVCVCSSSILIEQSINYVAIR